MLALHNVHKLRNILDHLPGHKRATIGAALRAAWSAASEGEARTQLQAIERRLESHHPGAVAALREGLDETLTLLTLGVKGALYRTLCSTNPIENLQGTLKRVAKRVKRWRGGSMVLRWAATALIEAEKRFRRIRGHRDLAVLNTSCRHLLRTQYGGARSRMAITGGHRHTFKRRPGHPPPDGPDERPELRNTWCRVKS